jgi:CheY-like chemotaxis protein
LYFNEVFFRFKDSVKAKDERRALPEVIFLDWNMPGLSGEQCLKAIRKIQRLDNIPVIVFTTSTAEQDKKNVVTGRFQFHYQATKFARSDNSPERYIFRKGAE